MTTAGLSTCEAARRCGLSAHTLRWYEPIGLLDRVPRGSDGRRRFGPQDMRWLGVLMRLRATGMPVAQMVRYAQLVRAGEGTERERLAVLAEHRERVRAALEVQREYLAFIDRKIGNYRNVLGDAPETETKRCER